MQPCFLESRIALDGKLCNMYFYLHMNTSILFYLGIIHILLCTNTRMATKYYLMKNTHETQLSEEYS